MNKKIAVLALMIVSAGVVLSGCQSIGDQMGSKLVEGIINSSTNGEVKVNLDDVKNGKVTLQTKDGAVQIDGDGDSGSFEFTGANGEKATIKGNSGSTRPADAPADMPSLDNASDFAYFTITGMTSLSFSVADKDLKSVCQKEMSALEGVGWTADASSFSLESSDGVMKSYVKGIENLIVTCGSDGDRSTVALQKTTKES